MLIHEYKKYRDQHKLKT